MITSETTPPSFPTNSATAPAGSLSRYELLAKSLVKHNAEKGRIVEGVVKSALRAILPGRFSIGTGFAITASERTPSSQLDIIIYDSLFNSPITLEGGIGLFPIECVYGFVEVKTGLNQKDTLHEVANAIKTVREFAKDKRYVDYRPCDDGQGGKVVAEFEFTHDLSPRSFVFAFNAAYADIYRLEADLKECTEKNDAHVHALTVMNKDWLIRQIANRQPHEFICTEGKSFATFAAAVRDCIQSMPMWAAAMKRYSPG